MPKSLSWVARLGAAAIGSVSKGAPYTQANSKAPFDHGVECLPSVMTPIDQAPAEDAASEACAAKLELVGRYLVVEDNGRCGGVNVSFNGLYVRAD